MTSGGGGLSDGQTAGTVVGLALGFLLLVGVGVAFFMCSQGYIRGPGDDVVVVEDHQQTIRSWGSEGYPGSLANAPKLQLDMGTNIGEESVS